MENNAKAQTLNRSLGLAECVTTTAGAVIGVGLFTVCLLYTSRCV